MKRVYDLCNAKIAESIEPFSNALIVVVSCAMQQMKIRGGNQAHEYIRRRGVTDIRRSVSAFLRSRKIFSN